MASKARGVPLVIAGEEVNVSHEVVPLGSVRLDPDNPRIRFQIAQRKKATKLDEPALLELIREQPGYDGLQKAIRKAGGLCDPVTVRHNGLVIEGNSRVTVLKTLHKGNGHDPRWMKLPIVRLPKDVPEKAVAMLMASYHVAGKTVWRPYAQADQIYQLHHAHQWTLEQIADETRMSKREIEQYLEAYDYLVNEVLPHVKKGNGLELLESKWSHALEFVKRKNLAHLRKDPAARKRVAKLLVHTKITGIQVRELDKVMKNKQALSALHNKGSFKAAKEVLKKSDPVATSKVLREMEHLTQSIGRMEQSELMLLKTQKKARDVLIELHKTIRDVASVAGVNLGS